MKRRVSDPRRYTPRDPRQSSARFPAPDPPSNLSLRSPRFRELDALIDAEEHGGRYQAPAEQEKAKGTEA